VSGISVIEEIRARRGCTNRLGDGGKFALLPRVVRHREKGRGHDAISKTGISELENCTFCGCLGDGVL